MKYIGLGYAILWIPWAIYGFSIEVNPLIVAGFFFPNVALGLITWKSK